MSQYLCISGSSTRSISSDSYREIVISQDRLQDPYVRFILSHLHISQDPLQNPNLRIHVSASLYLRILCKIHISGPINQHPYLSQDPLQDPYLQAYVSASLHLRILYKIHVPDSYLDIPRIF